jgi:hypothetical protein
MTEEEPDSDPVAQLSELLRQADATPFIHRLDCAVMRKFGSAERGSCDKGCGPRSGPFRAKLTLEVEANDDESLTCLSCNNHRCATAVFVKFPGTGRTSIHGLCVHCLTQAAKAGMLIEG